MTLFPRKASIAAGDPSRRFVSTDVTFNRRTSPRTIKLDDIEYMIHEDKYQHQGLPGIREGTTQPDEPSEGLFDHTGSWWRNRGDWNFGAGQLYADFDAEAVSGRYYRSVNVDPWTHCELTMTKQPVGIDTTGTKASKMSIATDASGTVPYLYFAGSGGLKRYTVANTTATAQTGVVGTITGMTSDGFNTYVCTTTGIYKFGVASNAAIGTVGVAGSYTNIAFVGNRLLAARAGVLVEVGTAATETIIFTHYNPNFQWTALFAIGSKIYVGGYAGLRSEIYTLSTLDDGTLARGQEATSLPYGEVINTAIGHVGAAIMATSRGVRFMTTGGDGTLTYGPAIDEGGACYSLCADGEFVHFGMGRVWQPIDDIAGLGIYGNGTLGYYGFGIGKLSLSSFVDTLRPAYAVGLYYDDNGGAFDEQARCIARLGGQTWFASAPDGGSGLFGLFTDQGQSFTVSPGWLDTGWLRFGTLEAKRLTSLRVRGGFTVTGAGTGVGATIAVYAEDEHGNRTTPQTFTPASESGIDITFDGNLFDKIKLVFKFNPSQLSGSSCTSAPKMESVQMRAYPVSSPTQQWLLPLILADRVLLGDGEGAVVSLDALAAKERIVDAWETKRIIEYQEGDRVHRVRVDNFQIQPEKWNDDSGYFDVVMMVQLLSV